MDNITVPFLDLIEHIMEICLNLMYTKLMVTLMTTSDE